METIRAMFAKPDPQAQLRKCNTLLRSNIRKLDRDILAVKQVEAQLNSVQMQVNEAFAVRKIEGSIRASVGIMKDVNTLIRLPELAGTMQELSVELMKAGVIEEMVGESLPEEMDLEGEEVEADGEVDKVLGEILKDRMPKEKMPTVPVHQEPKQAEEEDEEDNEAMMDQMRDRLEALRS
ncbi:hypothetical protein VdG1_00840 [Verticillium dahliae VDG1]|nr:hypothetical protein VdG1_00840 [Verticillium dahliae VDG1]